MARIFNFSAGPAVLPEAVLPSSICRSSCLTNLPRMALEQGKNLDQIFHGLAGVLDLEVEAF